MSSCQTGLRSRPQTRVGFTMLEVTLVIFISGILIVGLGTLIEVPRMAVEQKEKGDVTVADRTLDILDRDIRYARDVTLIDTKTLQVTASDSSVITYSWAGSVLSPLVREVGGRSIELIDRLSTVVFEVANVAVDVVDTSPLTAVQTDVTAGQFSSFSLNAGYTHSGQTQAASFLLGGRGGRDGGLGGGDSTTQTDSGSGSGSGSVDTINNSFQVTYLGQAGISFVADLGGAGEEGDPTAINLRLRRSGSVDMTVLVYDAIDEQTPNLFSLVASGHLRNAKINTLYRWHSIPLVTHKRLHHGSRYFVKLLSTLLGSSAEVEWQTLSDAAAAAPSSSRFVTTSNGLTFSSKTGANAHASQARFQVIANKTVATGGTLAASQKQIPVAVTVTLALATDVPIRTSVPITNNVALVLHR